MSGWSKPKAEGPALLPGGARRSAAVQEGNGADAWKHFEQTKAKARSGFGAGLCFCLRAVSGNNEKKESGIFNRSLALEHAAKNIENFPLAFLHPLCYK